MNFKLKHLPDRTKRPRKNGLTMVMDKGLGLRSAEDLVQSSGNFIDLIKLGFGSSIITDSLNEKIKIYQQAGIKVYFGGTLLEAFLVRKQLNEFIKTVHKFNVDLVEVSDGSISMPHEEKCEIIYKLSKEIKVISEVGSKEEGIIIRPNMWIEMMISELEAGSWKVIAEARESGTVGIYRPSGKAHVMLINKIINKVDPENIIWESPKKPQQVYMIKTFGPNVNLGNIAPDEVIALESLRLGLRSDTFFDFIQDKENLQYKPE
ncbi:MAG TPA: phosphosulfolactate synthase [Bacteroidia bacterium]|nr:phosphosulfolactate synthase [Bacteroidia bacterium]HNT80847.1 phosphosulfolactate synthase [Bacteroidia bacterium]